MILKRLFPNPKRFELIILHDAKQLGSTCIMNRVHTKSTHPLLDVLNALKFLTCSFSWYLFIFSFH